MASDQDQSTARKILITATALLVGLAAGIVAWQYWPADCGGRFSGMSKTDTGECIGIVGSSEILDASVAKYDRVYASYPRLRSSGGRSMIFTA